ncbi:Uncharacterized protein DBV15_07235 [Temnothorax longispinosus]|uniref:Uncharacterized protein n=1 Tax=Temnothorax longispinosus TaxID=300112 RepID=A0A4S2JLI4_9HYME|nr:Uncharacterized protein DBV15_07235 [Temnothorax longispinosus]
MPVVRVYFWVTDGWLFGTSRREGERQEGVAEERKRERERERKIEEMGGRKEESPTVRYWRMISCLHSSDPVSNEGEMRAGPIWNNRIPFAIVFLSVSLFLGPAMGTNARIGYPPVYACVVTNARARQSAHTFVPVMRYTYGSRDHYAFCPSAPYARDFMRPAHTYSIRVHYATSSILVESVVQRHAAATKSCERDSVVRRHEYAAPCWYRDASPFDECTRLLWHNLSSI